MAGREEIKNKKNRTQGKERKTLQERKTQEERGDIGFFPGAVLTVDCLAVNHHYHFFICVRKLFSPF